MAPSLYAILRHLVDSPMFFIDRAGICMIKQGGGSVVEVHEAGSAMRVELPEKVDDYLRHEGLSNLVEITNTVRQDVRLRRLSDDEEITVAPCYIEIRCQPGRRRRLEAHGFKPLKTGRWVGGYYIAPEEYAEFVSFLRESGVKFEEDIPPWMKTILDEWKLFANAKPSSRRPGSDAAHFLGFR